MKEDIDSPFIRVFSGNYIDVFNPDPDSLLIEDIAHSLSMQCRYNGHIHTFYSVAEHSIWCADQVDEELRFTALMHDVSEAYLTDFSSPIKNRIKEYLEIEDSLMSVLSKKFGFIYPFPEEIKRVDRLAAKFEWDNMVIRNRMEGLPPTLAREKFLYHYIKYKKS